MGEERRVWHVLFGDVIEEEKPEGMLVTAEEILSQQQRADLILLWRDEATAPPTGSFWRLWAVLPKLTILEYKSRGRPPERGVLDQLFAYGHILLRKERSAREPRIEGASQLGLVLVAGSLTPTLEKELAGYGLTSEALGGGLYRVRGALIQTWILGLDELSVDVDRPLMGTFGTRPFRELDKEGAGWLAQRFMGERDQLESLPDYEEAINQLASSKAGEQIFKERLRMLEAGEVTLSEDLIRSEVGERIFRQRLQLASAEDLARSEVGKRIFRKRMQFTTAAELHADIEQLPEDMKSELRRRLLGDSES